MSLSNGRSRALPPLIVLLTLPALSSAVAQDAAPAHPGQPPVSLRHEEGRLVVRTPFYEAAVAPDNGGRIVSFVFRGVEITGLAPSGQGGLMEETHTADFPFRLLPPKTTEREVALTLSADAGNLRVWKTYTFSADHPWLAVGLTFENRSPFRLIGDAVPAMRALVLPGGLAGADRTLYCLDRGAGAETLSPDIFLSAADAADASSLRWIAAADPASRRALGFTLTQDGPFPACGLLAPLRTDAGIVLGWSYPAIPAGQSLSTTVWIVPLDGFAAVAELNQRFVAESLPQSASPLAVRLEVMALRDELRDVSVITRTYDESGAELDPCDALLFNAAAPFALRTGSITWPGQAGKPAWLLHEVYSEGRRLNRVAVRLGLAGGMPPITPEPPAPPEFRPVQGLAPASLASPAIQPGDRAFFLWRFDGLPPQAPLERLELTMTQEEARTVFLGLHALRPVQDLHFTIAGAGDVPPGRAGATAPLPAAAAYVWQVEEEGAGPALLRPAGNLSLDAGETVWLALTADAHQLKPGAYAARLVVGAGDSLTQVPLAVGVLPLAPASRDAFALWHIQDPPAGAESGAGVLSESAISRLTDYGVSCLTVPVSPDTDTAAMATVGRAAAARGLLLLSFSSGERSRPPAAAFPGSLLLPSPDPVWILAAGSASPGAVRAAGDAGYSPALLCEDLRSIPTDILAQAAGFRFWLVKDGCEAGRVPQMVQSGAMQASASVWLYLDLRETDWQRAATEVRSAFWAAAWQGLAGAAVRCPMPGKDVEQQPVIWHILRDARNEVALWRSALAERTAPQRAVRAASGRTADAEEVRRLALLEGVVGTGETCDLRLAPERRPFRMLHRVLPGDGRPALSLDDFEKARADVLAALRGAPPASPNPREHLYWRGIPLTEDGRVRWAIVSGASDAGQKAAVDLQQALRKATGRELPVSPTFPNLRAGAPLLVWALAGTAEPADWPEAVRAALAKRPTDQLVIVDLRNGPTFAALRNGFSLKALLKTFRPAPGIYPMARDVQ
jgi:hypothetical protein